MLEMNKEVGPEISVCEEQKKDSLEKEQCFGGPVFEPRLSVQRYFYVKQKMEKHAVKHLVDFGSAECKISRFLVQLSSLERLTLVDLDASILTNSRHAIRPLTMDYIVRRDVPLKVQMYQGSVTVLDRSIVGCDAVSMVEIIEHLTPDVLDSAVQMVFGKLQPQVVVVTTPNADFNVLFPNFSGFRHWDHKFEWSRDQFRQWCDDICSAYPYTVELGGVGEPPSGSGHLGYCSQAAVFLRSHPVKTDQTAEISDTYKLITESIYPHKEHIVSKEESLVMEIEYSVRQYINLENMDPVLCRVCQGDDPALSLPCECSSPLSDPVLCRVCQGDDPALSLPCSSPLSDPVLRESSKQTGNHVTDSRIQKASLERQSSSKAIENNSADFQTGSKVELVDNSHLQTIQGVADRLGNIDSFTSSCEQCMRARYQVLDREVLIPVLYLMNWKVKAMLELDQLVKFLQSHGYRLTSDSKFVIVQSNSDSDNSDRDNADSNGDSAYETFADGIDSSISDTDKFEQQLQDTWECWD